MGLCIRRIASVAISQAAWYLACQIVFGGTLMWVGCASMTGNAATLALIKYDMTVMEW